MLARADALQLEIFRLLRPDIPSMIDAVEGTMAVDIVRFDDQS